MEKFKVGDRVRRIKGKHRGMSIGDEAKVMEVSGSHVYLEEYNDGHDPENLELIEEQSLTPLKETKMKRKIIRVLAVDKKTNKVLKNESVVAENEQSAILKAFGVDVESVYIKTTDEGEYTETKPTSVVLEKEIKK